MNDLIAISPKALGMITIALNLMGVLLKHGVPFLENRWIPHILIATGGITACVTDGWRLEIFLLGAAAALTSIGAHQTAVMTIDAIKGDPEKKQEPPQ